MSVLRWNPPWHLRCTAKPRVRSLGMLLIGVMGLAACYEPSLRDCSIQCAAADQCLGSQVCVDGYCADPGVSRCDDDQADASVPADAADLCSQRCTSGTCIGGVCTIDCSASQSCWSDVTCPAGVPCHVICGDSSCTKKINCTSASSCDVDCVGSSSCTEEIQCPANRDCDVTCSGDDSCQSKVKCGDSCACDISCSGEDSCAQPPECPSAACSVGNACTAQGAGCNTCQ